jgi:hypothetical protein
MNDKQKRKMISGVLDRFVKWYNYWVEAGLPPQLSLENQFYMWCEYNCKKELEIFGFDLLLRYLELNVSFVGPKYDEFD